jgi:hypothetical protein
MMIKCTAVPCLVKTTSKCMQLRLSVCLWRSMLSNHHATNGDFSYCQAITVRPRSETHGVTNVSSVIRAKSSNFWAMVNTSVLHQAQLQLTDCHMLGSWQQRVKR